uniref:Malectin domain-containing protein n=1 Tax=Coccolithus braarudii TaxID=221442 RepID=A0A7S0L1V7_9EUKA|mmetsp:Transcript_15715/g.34073  ORF Transcript_15715/g.34073 Transcript_15715/m.34073 type:complete len:527 (+) Transcript_15715:70-1650(+)
MVTRTLLRLLCASALVHAVRSAPLTHCANPAGAFIGLVADQAYTLRLPPDAPGNPERWALVTEATSKSQHGQEPAVGSFTGTYVQALPDDRDTYNNIYGAGSFTPLTGLDFYFYVTEPGMHTLFLRWTGGDTAGGGDSLYAVMRDADTDLIVAGKPTFKPKLVPIMEAPNVAGCCYHHQTHACTCFATEQEKVPGVCDAWQASDKATRFGAQCPAGEGQMEAVPSPRWYLYAGQAVGNVMDFNAEPWDATCEAEGVGTADTGLDFAAWDLPTGKYRLVFYPREDGTAVDAFYLAGPNTPPPPQDLRLQLGDSTVDCKGATKPASKVSSGLWVTDKKDAPGWGYRSKPVQGADASAAAGGACGICLVPVEPSECPSGEELLQMQTCDLVGPNELCEADGECGTNIRLNNCDSPPSTDLAAGNVGERTRRMRQNDVYRRMTPKECEAANAHGLGGGVVALLVLLALGGMAGIVVCVYKRGAIAGSLGKAIQGTRVSAPISGTTSMNAPMVNPSPMEAAGYVRRDDLQR